MFRFQSSGRVRLRAAGQLSPPSARCRLCSGPCPAAGISTRFAFLRQFQGTALLLMGQRVSCLPAALQRAAPGENPHPAGRAGGRTAWNKLKSSVWLPRGRRYTHAITTVGTVISGTRRGAERWLRHHKLLSHPQQGAIPRDHSPWAEQRSNYSCALLCPHGHRSPQGHRGCSWRRERVTHPCPLMRSSAKELMYSQTSTLC